MAKDITAIENMTREEKLEFLASLDELHDRVNYNKLMHAFPDEGPYSRDKYQKHIEFLNASANFRFNVFCRIIKCNS